MTNVQKLQTAQATTRVPPTRPNDWIDTNTFETKYGIDVLHDGKWKHLAEDGKPCIYSTPAERDAKRAEYRKESMPPNP